MTLKGCRKGYINGKPVCETHNTHWMHGKYWMYGKGSLMAIKEEPVPLQAMNFSICPYCKQSTQYTAHITCLLKEAVMVVEEESYHLSQRAQRVVDIFYKEFNFKRL